MQVELSPEIEATVRWAQRRQAEEAELERLCQQHPGLQDLREKFDLMRALVAQELKQE